VVESSEPNRVPDSARTRGRTVSIANRHPRLRVDRRAVSRLVATLDASAATIVPGAAPIPAGELSLVFLTDRDLAALHGRFLADPTTTDVITFEGDAALGTAGEICVSADTAAAYSGTHGQDFSTELTLYLVHGWLHLAGLDDLVPANKRAMRRAEDRAMKILGRKRAIPQFVLARTRSTQS
jgi:probable rRNA maturation factor